MIDQKGPNIFTIMIGIWCSQHMKHYHHIWEPVSINIIGMSTGDPLVAVISTKTDHNVHSRWRWNGTSVTSARYDGAVIQPLIEWKNLYDGWKKYLQGKENTT